MVNARLSGRVGLALGSGAARGWAHIGVIRALEAAGIVPEIIAGTSVGAIVGGAYVSGQFDEFEAWVRALDRSNVVRNLDLSFRGGLFKGTQFFDFMSPKLPDRDIETLERPFAAVATDLENGREIWLREGSLHSALRASVAMPGLITPARRDGRWLVDGGLVNPVPVSLCRAMGAETVIAVDLNTTLLRRTLTPPGPDETRTEHEDRIEAGANAAEDGGSIEGAAAEGEVEGSPVPAAESSRLRRSIEVWARELRDRIGGEGGNSQQTLPSLYEVLANSLNIMQIRITRSRMAGDPPELLITPQLATFALLDLDRGDEAIREGERAAHQALASMAGAESSSTGPMGRS
ncbi:MAG TPA: patatin [Deltaproteobacteria bacterium]|nr:patatin [Deltaproteobacteria bacterium]